MSKDGKGTLLGGAGKGTSEALMKEVGKAH